MTFNENFRNSADGFRATLRRTRKVHVSETRYTSAFNANEVRMFFTRRSIGVQGFKPPDVISQLGACEQVRIREIVEISKHGRLIEAQWNQHFCKIGVR